MRIAKEMYLYCKEKGFGQGQNEKWGIKHFSLIEESLLNNEDVLMAFIGLHNYKSLTKHDNNYAYVITNQRIIMAQKRMMGNSIQTVSLNNINDITLNSGAALGIVTIDSIKEVFNIAVDKKSAKLIYNEIHNVLGNINKPTIASSNGNNSNIDDIYKLKELLDNGIITQEEFDLKKKQILGI